jgi:hypothetical protein
MSNFYIFFVLTLITDKFAELQLKCQELLDAAGKADRHIRDLTKEIKELKNDLTFELEESQLSQDGEGPEAHEPLLTSTPQPDS